MRPRSEGGGERGGQRGENAGLGQAHEREAAISPTFFPSRSPLHSCLKEYAGSAPLREPPIALSPAQTSVLRGRRRFSPGSPHLVSPKFSLTRRFP